MRKIEILFLFLFFFSSVISPQTNIENPEKPLSQNAGRVLKLEEVFRITDESGDFYFTSPQNLKVDFDGNFFIIDENQFLKFSVDGKYLKNLLKKGQGPGEISTRYTWGLSYFFSKDDIFLYDSDGNKIIRMDDEGNLIEEIRLTMTRLHRMYGLTDDGFIFMYESPIKRGQTGFRDVDMSIILVSKDGSSSRTIMTFPKKLYTDKNFGMDWAPFYGLLESDGQNLFVCHTCEYNIAHADLNKGEVIRCFNRKYPRAKYMIPEGLKKLFAKSTIKRPEKKYEDDVLGLFFHNDQLWVKTSTKDEKKGVLIDVFNKQGKYIDNFYIDLKGELMAVQEDIIFVREKDENENIQIVKYRIIG